MRKIMKTKKINEISWWEFDLPYLWYFNEMKITISEKEDN